jgi:hypothetical protein
MRQCVVLVLMLGLGKWVLGCPMSPSAMPSALSCIKSIVCSSDGNGIEHMMVQNCNKMWYYGSTTESLSYLLASASPSSDFAPYLPSTNIKATASYALVDFGTKVLFCYPFIGSNYYGLHIACAPVDYEALELLNGKYMAVVLCGTTV